MALETHNTMRTYAVLPSLKTPRVVFVNRFLLYWNSVPALCEGHILEIDMQCFTDISYEAAIDISITWSR